MTNIYILLADNICKNEKVAKSRGVSFYIHSRRLIWFKLHNNINGFSQHLYT